jgi:hypothetical protein
MSNREHPRDAAIRQHAERKAEQRREEEERNRKAREQASLHETNESKWRNSTNGVIQQSVHKLDDDYARRSSLYHFGLVPSRGTDVTYEIRESGKLDALAHLKFEFNPSGRVTAHTDVGGTGLPRSISLDECDAAWVEGVADEVMIAFLDSH